MTVALAAGELAGRIEEKFPDSLEKTGDDTLVIRAASLPEVAAYLKDDKDLLFDYFNYVTAVDYYSYFELVYQLTSLKHNHSVVFKVRVSGRENPAVPSLTGLWQGANFQEREIYDLMGISFTGHPNLKRMFLWEGFPGYPLRKDWNG